uniref:Uncharacterized protein n=1 Tax=Aegilops tauschii TaxID=37682 RepID=R7W7Q8_AEGTA
MPGSAGLLISASMAALLALSLFTFLCSNRRQAHRASPSPSQRSVVDVELGLQRPCGIDEAVLAAYPTTVYSSAASRRDEGQMADAVTASTDGGQPPDDTHTTCAIPESPSRAQLANGLRMLGN